MSNRFSNDYPLPATDWEGLVQLIATRAGLTVQQARKHLANAEREGWIERVTLPSGAVLIRLTIPEYAR